MLAQSVRAGNQIPLNPERRRCDTLLGFTKAPFSFLVAVRRCRRSDI